MISKRINKMNKIFLIKCTVPCDIVLNGEKTNQTPPFFISTDQNAYITFLPQNKEVYLPLSVTLEQEETEYLHIIPFNTHTEIIFDPVEMPTKAKTLLNKKYKNMIFSVFTSRNSYLNIDGIKYSHKTSFARLINAELSTHGDIAVISGETEKNTHYILVFDCKNKKILLETCANIIENGKNSVKTAKFSPSISGYGVVNHVDFSTKRVSTYNIYKHSEPIYPDDNRLVPMAFLEAIKYGDYNLARHYLGGKPVKNEHLKTFFGDIRKIYFNGLSDIPNYTILTDKYKNYNFSMENGKIIEIEENEDVGTNHLI